MQNKLDLYTHKCLDVDLSEYRVINADVIMYRKGIKPQIDAILRHFREVIDKSAEMQLFIKGNRLFFTIDNVKYYDIVSCWVNEWEYIDSLMSEISKYSDNVAYKQGELD